MKTITYADIKAFGPCYDPNKHIPETWTGTLVDILKMTGVPAKDKLWAVVRHQFMSDRQLHLYGLACARMSESNSTDPRVKVCNDTTEAYLKGEATKEQLNAAAESAESAAESTRYAAAESAARYAAAESAARSARSAWSAARYAAESAESAAWSARYAAESAAESARYAAESTRYAAAESAESAARSAWSAESAAWSAAEEKQCLALIEILENND